MSRHPQNRGKIESAARCSLPLSVTPPRAGLNLVPSNSRPNLFGGD
jgi:hypothetical protein